MDIGSITIKLAESYSPKDNNMVLLNAWIVMGFATVVGIAVYYAFGQIRKILQPMSKGTPFHPTVSINIRKIAYVSIVELNMEAYKQEFIEFMLAFFLDF